MKHLLIVCVAAWATLSVAAQEPQTGEGGAAPDPWTPATFSEFRLRAIGPALMSGRISHIAVHPHDKQTWYIGVASGGVWKTTNAGTTFTPVFQNEGAYSIGAVAIDPKSPDTIWVGTGEANNQRSVGYGDGLYRSDDGGRTWRNVGLKTSEQIGRIAIDPQLPRSLRRRLRAALERRRRTRPLSHGGRRRHLDERARDQRAHGHQRRRH